MPKLSDAFVSSKLEPGRYNDSLLPGYRLNVGKQTKTYVVANRIKGGKVVERVVGRAGEMSAPEARERAAEFLKLMRQGIDPAVLLQQQQQENEARQAEVQRTQDAKAFTVRVAFEKWESSPAGKKIAESTRKLYRWVIFKHLDQWLDKPMSDITPDMISDTYIKIASESVSSAGNAFRALRRLYSWAISKGLIATPNPVTILSHDGLWQTAPARQDVVSDKKLAAFVKAVMSTPDANCQDMVLLCLMLGLRRRECLSMRWTWFDEEERSIHIPTDFTKNGLRHDLPLGDAAYILLKRRFSHRASNTHVFPTTSSRAKDGAIVDPYAYVEKIAAEAHIKVTPHTLRRTFCTVAARLLPPYVVKELANHRNKNDVTQQHYVALQIENLRKPMALVEAHILKHAGIKFSAFGERGQVIALRNGKRLSKRQTIKLTSKGVAK